MIKRVSCKLWQFCREKAVHIWCFWVKFSDFKGARSYWNSKVMRGKSVCLEGMSHHWKLSLENKNCPFPLPFNIKKGITTEGLTSGISCELVMLEDVEGNAFGNALNAPHQDPWMCPLEISWRWWEEMARASCKFCSMVWLVFLQEANCVLFD